MGGAIRRGLMRYRFADKRWCGSGGATCPSLTRQPVDFRPRGSGVYLIQTFSDMQNSLWAETCGRICLHWLALSPLCPKHCLAFSWSSVSRALDP